jgi:hypothetical protein
MDTDVLAGGRRMSSFSLFQPEGLAFLCGLALFWVGGLALRLARGSQFPNWRLFALFALVQALAQWSLLSANGDSRTFFGNGASLVLSPASFLALMEWSRREIKCPGDRRLQPWIYGLAMAIAALILATSGTSGMGTVVRYALALPGGVLAAVALGQAAQRRPAGWGLALASAAIALFAVGYAFSVGALQAFAALGLLMGIWREYREVFPLPKSASAVRRWHMPVVFMLLVIAGTIGTHALIERSEKPAVAVALMPSVDGNASDMEGVEVLLDAIEIDPRELARQRADEQRYRQGLTILVVLGVVAVVWIGLARYAGAK